MRSDDAAYYRQRAESEAWRAEQVHRPDPTAARRQPTDTSLMRRNGADMAIATDLGGNGPSGQPAPGRPFHPAYSLADTQLARSAFVSDDERSALAQAPTTVRSFGRGDELVREKSMPDCLYFLAAGWAYRYMTLQNGGRQITMLMTPGDVCNLDTLMFPRAEFGVRALTQAKVVALPRQEALSLGTRYPGVGRAFTWLALTENAILGQWAVCLGKRSAQERLAHFLCEMHHRLGRTGGFSLPLTQELIAEALGMTPVHINRTIKLLRDRRLVGISSRTVTIVDGDGLCALADFDPGYLDQISSVGDARASLAG